MDLELLALMLDGQGEIALPLATFNPMSKPHVAELLDALIATDAEVVARAALNEAAESVGYPPLGVPPWGGFAVALAEAPARGWEPASALLGTGTVTQFSTT